MPSKLDAWSRAGGLKSKPILGEPRSPFTGTCTNPKLSQESVPPALETLRWGVPGLEKISTWMRGAERLLETLPGVLFASLEGDLERGTEVRLRVEEEPPVSEILEAARDALGGSAAECPPGVFFRVQVASGGGESPYGQDKTVEESSAASPNVPESGGIRLITHQVRSIGAGVMGVELTLGLLGRRFAGGASGQANRPGSARVPALATLSALGSYIRFASTGVGGPTLELEDVSEFSLGGSRVAVVVVTMSGHAAPLIAAWPLKGASGPAVVRATLEAAARRVTRLSSGEDRPFREAIHLLEPAGVGGSGGVLWRQAESLLETTRAIGSARIVLDSVKGFRIHVLAISEVPQWEVSRMVMTLLKENLGLRVRRDQITVVQSRLSAEELDRVLGRSPPIASTEVPEAFVSRLTLADLHIVDAMGGKKEVGVRIVGGANSFDGRRQAAGGDGALLRPLAEATLDAVGGLMQRAGRPVALFLKEVRRFRRRGDQGVVVLVEATADGRKTLMSGAAFSAESFERTSVAAVLQATNAFVAGTLEFPRNGEENSEADPAPPEQAVSQASQTVRTQTGSAAPPDPSSGWRSEPSRRSDSSGPSDSPNPSDAPNPSDSPRPAHSSEPPAPEDYVGEVLSRIQSTRQPYRAPPPPN